MYQNGAKMYLYLLPLNAQKCHIYAKMSALVFTNVLIYIHLRTSYPLLSHFPESNRGPTHYEGFAVADFQWIMHCFDYLLPICYSSPKMTSQTVTPSKAWVTDV